MADAPKEANRLIKKATYITIGSRPTMFYKSFAAFKKGESGRCQKCFGAGTIKDPSVPFNPQLGLKFAPRVTCAECSGKGERSEQDLRQLYAVYTKTAEKAQGDYDKRERTVHAAFKKLTPKEVKAIAGI